MDSNDWFFFFFFLMMSELIFHWSRTVLFNLTSLTQTLLSSLQLNEFSLDILILKKPQDPVDVCVLSLLFCFFLWMIRLMVL